MLKNLKVEIKVMKKTTKFLGIFQFAILLIVCFAFSASTLERRGRVIAVQGDEVTIKLESTGSALPAVGDILDILEYAHGGIAAFDLGDWKITEVKGDIVKAKVKNLVSAGKPKVNMLAIIHVKQNLIQVNIPPDNAPRKTPPTPPCAIGKVIMKRGQNVTIKLGKVHEAVAIDDIVKLSYSFGDDKIEVGTWRVTKINANGTVEADPKKSIENGEPNINMDAQIFSSGKKRVKSGDGKQKKVKSKQSIGTDSKIVQYEKACFSGDADACSELGFLYGTGKGVALDYHRAVEFYRKSRDGGSAAGYYNLGIMYRDGLGVAKDYKKAVALLRTSCDKNYTLGCFVFANMLREGKGIKQDFLQAYNLYKKACTDGFIQACNSLGYMYENGKGVNQDSKLAVDYYKKACDGGDATGCANIGYMYKNGSGVPQDYGRSLEYYKKGCDKGDGRGCNSLGNMYENGEGVAPDNKLAADYYKKACDGGYAIGCSNTGYMYQNGRGVNQDYGRSIEYYKKGCDYGDARGCGNLGSMVYNGSGTSADPVRGRKLIEQACKMGHTWSCNNLKELGK